jgi:hypothetical protein
MSLKEYEETKNKVKGEPPKMSKKVKVIDADFDLFLDLFEPQPRTFRSYRDAFADLWQLVTTSDEELDEDSAEFRKARSLKVQLGQVRTLRGL